MDEAMLRRVMARVYAGASGETDDKKTGSSLTALLASEQERERLYTELSGRSPVLRDALRPIRRALSERLRVLRTARFLQTGETARPAGKAAVRGGTLTLLRQAYHSAAECAGLYAGAGAELNGADRMAAALGEEAESIEALLRRIMQ